MPRLAFLIDDSGFTFSVDLIGERIDRYKVILETKEEGKCIVLN